MGKETDSPADESTQPEIRKRRRKVTDLKVQLATDLNLPLVVEPWERALLLPHLAKWLDDDADSKRTQKESSNGE